MCHSFPYRKVHETSHTCIFFHVVNVMQILFKNDWSVLIHCVKVCLLQLLHLKSYQFLQPNNCIPNDLLLHYCIYRVNHFSPKTAKTEKSKKSKIPLKRQRLDCSYSIRDLKKKIHSSKAFFQWFCVKIFKGKIIVFLNVNNSPIVYYLYKRQLCIKGKENIHLKNQLTSYPNQPNVEYVMAIKFIFMSLLSQMKFS